MESFGIQLFIFSIITAMIVVFVLVYNLTRNMLGKEPDKTDDVKFSPSEREPVKRDPDSGNTSTSFYYEE